MNPSIPYNDLPHLPPAGHLESHAVLKACIRARTALMELKTSADLIPNQTVLINVLPLLEARASTEVENIVTTNDALFRQAAMGEAHPDAATKEALNYRGALLAGFQSLQHRPLCTATAEEVCCAIKNQQMEVRRMPGTRLANNNTGEIIYTPPEGESILRDKLTNWENFLHREQDIDPLIRMAVAHYQFEAIHPFTDGNGRTGRVMNLLFLISEGLLREPVLYLSRYILRNRSDYYRLLNSVTHHQTWEPWVLFMLRGVEETAQWTVAKINSIRQLVDKTAASLRTTAPAIYSRELVEAIFGQAYCRIGNLVEAGIGQRQTVAGYLRKLTDLGVLTEISNGREKLFLNQAFADLLFSDVPVENHLAEPPAYSNRVWETPAEFRSEPIPQPDTAVKILRAADLPGTHGQPNEMTGPATFLRVFGADRLTGRIRWVRLSDGLPLWEEGQFTWYDARARSAGRTGRSEWRFYYDQAFPGGMPGDTLLVVRYPDGTFAGAVLPAKLEAQSKALAAALNAPAA